MAIVQLGPIIGRISGNVGGASFANARGTTILRKSRRSSFNGSIAQGPPQVKIGVLARIWADKSSLDQDAWRAAATRITFPNRLGIQRNISGYQYFLKINMPLDLLTAADVLREAVELPPTNVSSQVTAQITFTSGIAGGIDMIFDGLPGASSYSGLVYGNLLYRSTATQFNNTWRSFGPLGRFGDGSRDITTAWQNVFELPVLGQYIALRFQPLQNSAPIGAQTIAIIETLA